MLDGVSRMALMRSLLFGFISCLCVVALSCSSEGIQGVSVKGKVVKNGQVIPLQGDYLVMYLVSLGGQDRGIRSMGICSPADGTFVCRGPTHRGIPAGNYRIELWPGKAEVPPHKDYLFNREFKDARSPLNIALTKENCEKLVVDVGAKTVTAP